MAVGGIMNANDILELENLRGFYMVMSIVVEKGLPNEELGGILKDSLRMYNLVHKLVVVPAVKFIENQEKNDGI
jgi:hypothetical protein